MKVVGLLSGGKDSCYNLLHCVQQGHEIVALATLAPAPGANDELDSYMYQTVGHDAVHLVAQAMQIPLYRQTISGSALNQGAEYGSRVSDRNRDADSSDADEQAEVTHTDETEDLYHLLRQVKGHHPDVEAVSVGAILSNYQRIRVEHVCFREAIQLQPLTYLWQRSQAQLLAEMTSSSAAPFTSIMIKVAGIGLSQSDLGKTLHQMQPKLVKLHSLYGAHICGEGGEYETLTLDSPLFAHRIVIDETETVIHSDSAFGSVSYLKITKAHLEPKAEQKAVVQVPTPELLDSIGRRTLRAVSQSCPSTEESALRRGSEEDKMRMQLPAPTMIHKGRWLTVANVTGQSTPTCTLEQEVVSAFSAVSSLLTSASLDLTHIVHINLFLADQSLFPAINAVYKTHFGVSPPTRACVGLKLANLQAKTSKDAASPPRFIINVVAFDDKTPANTKSRNRGDGKQTWAAVGERKALHVQSRSFWSPANIGPYSQAVVPSRSDRIYIAGQIGLLPSDLSLSSVFMQNSLAIQHARRIYGAVMGDMASRDREKGWIEGGICWHQSRNLNGARDTWLAQLSSDDDEEEEEETAAAPQFANDQESQQAQDCWLGRHVTSVESMPPILFASLADQALPRGAAIEWQLTAHTGRIVSRDVVENPTDTPSAVYHETEGEDEDEDEVGLDAPSPTPSRTYFTQSLQNGHICHGVHHTLLSVKTRSSFGVLSFTAPPLLDPSSDVDESLTAALHQIADLAYSLQILYVPSPSWAPASLLEALTSRLPPKLSRQFLHCQHVPVDDLHILDLRSGIHGAPSICQVSLALVWHGI